MKFTNFQYQRPSIDKVRASIREQIIAFQEATRINEQITVVKKINEVRMEFESAQMLAHIRHTLDTTNLFYEEEHEFFNKHYPEYEEVITQFYQTILETPFKIELEEALGKQFFRTAESKIRTFSTAVMDLLIEENNLTSQYQKLIATARIQFNGEELTLSQVEKYISEPNREIRKSAAQAKYEFFTKNEQLLDEIFAKLVKLRDSIAKKLGFNNFTELAYLRWNRTGWNSDSAATFRDHVLKYFLPISSDLIESQRQRLGLESIKIYDEKVQFLSGNPVPKGDAKWVVKQGRKLYNDMSLETKDFYNEMVNRELFDLINKNGKANIGYCTFLWKQRAPFIFANFNGTSNDIRVLVHEVGHAFQVYLALKAQELPEYFFPTMEASEIFSMSMEFFVFPWSELFFKEDADKHRFAHLSDSLIKIPKLCAGDEFQEKVYENPDMSPQERKTLWTQIEKKYMPERDNDDIPFLYNGGIWQEITHIYEVPFYFIDYALAQISALEFWRMAKEDWNKAWETYMYLSSIGGSKSFLELLEAGNLHSPFDEGTFIFLKSFINKQLEDMKTPV